MNQFAALTDPHQRDGPEQRAAEGEARRRHGHRHGRRLPGLLAPLRHRLLRQDGRI